MAEDAHLLRALEAAVQPLDRGPSDYDALLDEMGEARFVLLGEASHGTHEFYRERSLITRRLIEERGFDAIAIEGDWPDAHRVHRFIRDTGDEEAVDALEGFRRFPAWMWRNAEVLDLLGWLRAFNDARDADVSPVGFYGLDVYSLHASLQAVLGYLEFADPAAADRARDRYACFSPYAEAQAYGYAAVHGFGATCQQVAEEEVADLLSLQHVLEGDEMTSREAFFDALQNARVVRCAEAYYRDLYGAERDTWNLRDTHMADTLDALAAHLEARERRPARIVVWAHNSHLGDARATESSRRGELNLGQLVRERHPGEVFSLGFSTFAGTVTAARDWGAPAQRFRVRPALGVSYESLFHRLGLERFLLPLRDPGEALGGLLDPRLQRAIGVVYRPDSERWSHYLQACLPKQFDALLHVDETRAVEPLERTSLWEREEPPETWPSGY